MIKLIMVLLVAVLCTSCIKNQTPQDLTAEKTNILTAGNWRLTDYRYQDAFQSGGYSSLPDCRKDDLRIFKNDGSYEINEGTSKCNAGDPQSSFKQWKFLNTRASHVELDGREYIVYKLDNTTFDISLFSLDAYAPEISYTYSKQ
jgi:hypothetical protein